MTSESIQKLIRTVPFEPFILNLADGHKVPVTHRELIAHRPGSRTVFVALEGEEFALVDLHHVASINSQKTNPPESR